MPRPLGNMFPYATETLVYVITESVYILPHSISPEFIYMTAIPLVVVVAFIMETQCISVYNTTKIQNCFRSRKF